MRNSKGKILDMRTRKYQDFLSLHQQKPSLRSIILAWCIRLWNAQFLQCLPMVEIWHPFQVRVDSLRITKTMIGSVCTDWIPDLLNLHPSSRKHPEKNSTSPWPYFPNSSEVYWPKFVKAAVDHISQQGATIPMTYKFARHWISKNPLVKKVGYVEKLEHISISD